jgi:CRISPR-associated protein Cmr6
MIHVSPAVHERVAETFVRRIKQQRQEVNVPCVRLRRGVARTLAASRYVQLPAQDECKEQRDDCRRLTSQAIKDGSTQAAEKLATWRQFAWSLAGAEKEKSPHLLFARQQSRLLVNLAGGVFENGGLSLDRVSGLPVIPGSAVKGCARRLVLAALQEWTSERLTTGDFENPLASVIDGFDSPAGLLLEVAVVFGWSDLEWKGREDFEDDAAWLKKRPDFAWASGEHWAQIRKTVAAELCERLGIKPDKPEKPWESLPHFAGTISFLPAYPWDRDPGIDLDVVTCHHGKYYQGDQAYPTALDTEEPVPVVFPAIAPGQNWVFLLIPTARAGASHLAHARRWLAHGLEIFGIGAKTNAGYGWFDASESVAQEIRDKIAADQERAKQAAALKEEEQRRKIEEEKRRQAREAEAAATTDMTEDQKADWRLEQLLPQQFDAKVRNFHKEAKKGGPSDVEKAAIVRALRGARLESWKDLKEKAAKGGDPARAEQAIRTLNKQLNGDKMP